MLVYVKSNKSRGWRWGLSSYMRWSQEEYNGECPKANTTTDLYLNVHKPQKPSQVSLQQPRQKGRNSAFRTFSFPNKITYLLQDFSFLTLLLLPTRLKVRVRVLYYPMTMHSYHTFLNYVFQTSNKILLHYSISQSNHVQIISA
jgi:hypothetical protein